MMTEYLEQKLPDNIKQLVEVLIERTCDNKITWEQENINYIFKTKYGDGAIYFNTRECLLTIKPREYGKQQMEYCVGYGLLNAVQSEEQGKFINEIIKLGEGNSDEEETDEEQ